MNNRISKTGLFIAMILCAPQIAHAALEPRVGDAETESKTPAPRQAFDPNFPDIPRNHWAYVAMQKLGDAGLSPWRQDRQIALPRTMTRFEAAVVTARALNRLGELAPADTRHFADMSWAQIEREIVGRMWLAQFHDSIEALRVEFADELVRLGTRVDSMEPRTAKMSEGKS